MDPLKHQKRLGLEPGADIPPELLVDAAINGDPESVQFILQLCHNGLRNNAVTGIEKQLVKFFDEFGFREVPLTDLDNRALKFSVADAKKCVSKNRNVLGAAFVDFLLTCFSSLDDSDRPVAISAAFGLSSEKHQKGSKGLKVNAERDFEIAEDVDLILKEMKRGRLKKRVENFLSGQSEKLPQCIEKHLQLHGFPTTTVPDEEARQQLADAYPKQQLAREITKRRLADASIRQQLADKIRDEYRPTIRRELAEKIAEVTRENGYNSKAASEIYRECSIASAGLVKMILDDDRLSPADHERLTMRLNTLNSYGAVPRGNGKRGIGVRGIQAIYTRNKDRLPLRTNRIRNIRSARELEKLLALDNPFVRKAIRIINSQNVGNHNRAELLKLEKQTPKNAQVVWPDLWDEFYQAVARAVEKQNVSHKNVNK